MTPENALIKKLFNDLCAKPITTFPKEREPLEAPCSHGVYIIRKDDKVLHVGRTHRAKNGLRQRLYNHLYGQSSFTEKHLHGSGKEMRKGYTYQYLEVSDPRHRALLEAYAVGILCPEHLGLGK